MNIQLLEYERELLDGGAVEQPVEEDLLTRELPVHFKARSPSQVEVSIC